MRQLTILAVAAGLAASAGAAHAAQTSSYAFTTLDNPGDPTFNQLLGINNNGVISGYFGMGTAGHPNQAYEIAPPYTKYVPANAPGSVQTQATGINAAGNITGFWSDTNTGTDANFGFIRWNVKGAQTFIDVNDPLVASSPPVTQVLGMNKTGIAAGFYNDANNNPQGFTYNVMTGDYTPVIVPNAVGDAATGINSNNLLCGFWTDGGGTTHGFTKALVGSPITFTVPGSGNTQFLGVNSRGDAVGFYEDSSQIDHGLIYNPATGNWTAVNDPEGVQGTVLNGINDKGEMVGFFTDAAGNVHGMIVTGGTMP
jgi:hypothetical protein